MVNSQMSIRGWRILGSLLILLSGCASGRIVKSKDVPLNEIKQIVEDSLPGGKRHVSPNGREYFSAYFEPGKPQVLVPEGARPEKRAYFHILILGARRPYDVEIRVPVERRIMQANAVGATYEQVEWDENLALIAAKIMHQSLEDRKVKHNLFEEFRAF